ncbi:MAG: hypothetical protein P4L76_17955 [Beijerinckiaceae bacterium]|nr:hypothetical protein [Beijerinckiaceae bacterium]
MTIALAPHPTPIARAEYDERMAAASMAGRLEAVLSLLRSNIVPGREVIALCERTLNEWERANLTTHEARIAKTAEAAP